MSDRAEEEAVAAALGVVACATCGGLMVSVRLPVRMEPGESFAFAMTADQRLHWCARCSAKFELEEV